MKDKIEKFQEELEKFKQEHANHIAELLAILKEEEEKKFPQVGDVFYYINAYGEIDCDEWEDEYVDKERLALGNLFKTAQEAKDHVRFLKMQEKMRQLAGCQKWIDWKCGDQRKFHLIYNARLDVVGVDSYRWIKASNTYYFKTNREVLETIKLIGEEDLKFYLTYTREVY